MTVNLAIIGDVHLAFNKKDVAYFNGSDIDLILFVGDLAQYTGRGGRRIARVLALLNKPTLIIPGNHDNVSAVQMLSETLGLNGLSDALGRGQRGRFTPYQEGFGPVILGGYSLHSFVFGTYAFDVIVCRPHSMGGQRLHFQRYLSEAFGVFSFEDSVQRLKERIDESNVNTLIFLSHNGPTGLGASRDDIWGCDFRSEQGDYGDADLEAAVAYAKSVGKQVLLVAAGHMHHALRGGGTRKWITRREETLYVNAAKVPRIEDVRGVKIHHHVRVELKGDTVTASPVERAETH